MNVGLFTTVAIYIVCWWVVLFCILPIGMSQGARERPEDGGDWGAPVAPPMKKKFITTTWVSALVWLLVMTIIWTGVLDLQSLPGS